MIYLYRILNACFGDSPRSAATMDRVAGSCRKTVEETGRGHAGRRIPARG